MIQPMRYSYKVDDRKRIHAGGAWASRTTASLYIDDKKISDQGIQPLDIIGRDLFTVGTSILTADRLSLRRPEGSREAERELRWQRQIDLDVAIEDPPRWRAYRGQLESWLQLLTDDVWSLTFSQARASYRQTEMFSTPPSKNSEVALFSGGLDSSAGMYVRSLRKKCPFIAVSVYGDNRRHKTQQDVLTLLRRLGVDVRSVALVHQVRSDPNYPPLESTQRSRAVAYLFLGAAVARACSLDHLASYEAGPGALNLPMNEAQIASQNTRATHPETLRQCELILRGILDRPGFKLDLPFLLETKGEVCAAAGQTSLLDLARLSCSCDEGESHKPGILHCGFCTSCLMRRVALQRALGPGDPTIYRPEPTGSHGVYDVEAFRFQALTLYDAAQEYRKLLVLDPLIRRVVPYLREQGKDESVAEQQICDLLRRYASESLKWLESRPFKSTGVAS
jgi:7-cyano-7-deazaguanine synthase in queuosine biosynthesis